MVWKQAPVALCAVLGLCFSDQAKAASGDIQYIDTLGLNASFPRGISVNGEVVGYCQTGTSPPRRAFSYAAGISRQLPTLGGEAGAAYAINNIGQIAGSAKKADNSVSYPVIHHGGFVTELGLPSGYTSGVTTGINDGGAVAGELYDTSANPTAFYYDGAYHVLPSFGGSASSAAKLNNAGTVVGFSDTLSGERKAYRWSGDGSLTDLGNLGGISSVAQDINNSGNIVGYSQNASGYLRAFLYSGSSMQDLGAFTGVKNSWAWAISDTNAVVGFYYQGTPTRAALWTSAKTFVDLDAWLDMTNPLQGSYWTLVQACDVNTNGLIVGYGTYNDGPGGLADGTRGFMLDASSIVPEPSTTMGVLSMLALGLTRSQRRTRKKTRMSLGTEAQRSQRGKQNFLSVASVPSKLHW